MIKFENCIHTLTLIFTHVLYIKQCKVWLVARSFKWGCGMNFSKLSLDFFKQPTCLTRMFILWNLKLSSSILQSIVSQINVLLSIYLISAMGAVSSNVRLRNIFVILATETNASFVFFYVYSSVRTSVKSKLSQIMSHIISLSLLSEFLKTSFSFNMSLEFALFVSVSSDLMKHICQALFF